jgi:hypothetical protein
MLCLRDQESDEFAEVAVNDRPAVHIMLPDNREPEVLSKPCTFNSDPIRERLQ